MDPPIVGAAVGRRSRPILAPKSTLTVRSGHGVPGRSRPHCRWLCLAVLGLGLAAGSCGGGGGGDADLPLVGEIAPAVAALENELGDAPQYFEIRATPLAVTLWVSADQGRRAIPYVYADGELADAGTGGEAGGFTFAAADALTFDPDHVLDQVVDDLEDSALTQFSIVGGEDGSVRVGVIIESTHGGQLDIRLSPDGEPLEVSEID